MLDTAQNTYNAFLDGIKKSSTGTVTPNVFNRLMNEWGMDEWLKENVSEQAGIDSWQKQVDGLQMLKVITDGQMAYNGDIMYEITPDVVNGYYFSKPDGITSLNNLGSSVGLVYPKYLRLTDVKYKINYVGNECGLSGVSDYLKAQTMRAGSKSAIEDNFYLQPADDNLYYEQINEKFKLVTGTGSNGYSMKIEYLRYPERFFFDPNRKVKGLLSILTNSVTAGSIALQVVTTAGTYQSAGYPTPSIVIPASTSKYVIASDIYSYITTNVLFAALNACSLNGNNVGIGQTGYDVISITLVLSTPAPFTYSTNVNKTATDVNIELPDQQRKEVVEHAVRVYLERVTDMRYKQYLNEEAIREQSNK